MACQECEGFSCTTAQPEHCPCACHKQVEVREDVDHATAFQWGEYEARHSSGDAWAVYLVRPAGRDGLNGSRLEQAGLTRENAMTLAKSLGKSALLSHEHLTGEPK